MSEPLRLAARRALDLLESLEEEAVRYGQSWTSRRRRVLDDLRREVNLPAGPPLDVRPVCPRCKLRIDGPMELDPTEGGWEVMHPACAFAARVDDEEQQYRDWQAGRRPDIDAQDAPVDLAALAAESTAGEEVSRGHTPGPWAFDGENVANQGFDVAVPDGGVLATAYYDDDRDEYSAQQAEANAHLLAAAPTLHHALARLVDALSPYKVERMATRIAAALAEARAVLARARGGAP